MDHLLFLIIGLLGLWVGTEITVRNAIVLARGFRVSELFIGMIILAFGTDLPEIVVSVNGALHNFKGEEASGVVVGNAIGSSICQISLVIGATALFRFLRVEAREIRYLTIELIGSTLLLGFIAFDEVIGWNDGAVLILAFLIYFLARLDRDRNQNAAADSRARVIKAKHLTTIGLLVAGLLAVTWSADLTVGNALEIAGTWGIRQSFIGAIIIGLGTSLPELAISVSAVLKGKTDLSVGNIIGSNIFDLLVPLGLGSLIADLRFDRSILSFDLVFLFIISLIVLYFLHSQRGLQRWEGLGLIVLYMAYAVSKYMLNI